jgi:hypothetical protein
MVEKGRLEGYREKGIPDVIYWPDREREKIHQKNCRPDPSQWIVNMRKHPSQRTADEVEAYNKKTRFLGRVAPVQPLNTSATGTRASTERRLADTRA